MFVDGGRIVLTCSTADFESQFVELVVHPQHEKAARDAGPIHESHAFGRSVFLYRDVEAERLADLGELRTPSLSDVFMAVIGNQPSAKRGVGV